MRKEFILNIALLLLINVLVKPFFIFGIDLTVQNRLPDGAYGLYFTLFNLTYIFQVLNDFGIQNFNNRHISQHPHLLYKYFPNLLALKLILSLLYVVLSMAIAAWGGYDGVALRLLLILLFNQALVQLTFFLRSNLSGLGFYRLDSVLSSLDKFLMLATCALVLWWPPLARYFSAEAFALAQTVALVLTALIVFVVLRSKTTLTIRPSWAQNWRAGLPSLLFLFKKSFPYALVILLMTAYSRLDAVLLERLLGESGKIHADVYAGGYRLLDACGMLGYLFASLLLPMFARMLRQGDSVRPLVSLSAKLIWAASITLAAAVCFARIDLVALMMPEKASLYRANTLGILIWTFVPVSLTYIFSTLLTADERLMQMNRFFLVGLGLDVVLNIVLIPHFQAIGSAMATVSTQTFIALAMIGLCVQAYGFRPGWRGVIQVTGFTLWVLGVDWFVFQYTDWQWYLQFGAALLTGLAGLFLFQLIDVRQILRIFT
jgi:O-antigen/teichoic acid export membrane protein